MLGIRERKKKKKKERTLTYRGRVGRYVSCLLILKCPLYAQVRIHLALSVSPPFTLFFPALLLSPYRRPQ